MLKFAEGIFVKEAVRAMVYNQMLTSGILDRAPGKYIPTRFHGKPGAKLWADRAEDLNRTIKQVTKVNKGRILGKLESELPK